MTQKNCPCDQTFILKRARGLIAGKRHIRQLIIWQLPGKGISGSSKIPAVFQSARPKKYLEYRFFYSPSHFFEIFLNGQTRLKKLHVARLNYTRLEFFFFLGLKKVVYPRSRCRPAETAHVNWAK
jgi:hypothetical protein